MLKKLVLHNINKILMPSLHMSTLALMITLNFTNLVSNPEGINLKNMVSEKIDWGKITTILENPPNGWKNTIDQDLSRAQNTLNPRIIEQQSKTLKFAGLCRCTINNGQLHFIALETPAQKTWYVTPRLNALQHILGLLIKKNIIRNNADFLVCLHDYCSGNKDVAIMTICRHSSSEHDSQRSILIPDIATLASLFNGVSKDIVQASTLPENQWDKKINKLFWRGRLTGCWGSNDPCYREKLAAIGMKNPRMDIGITEFFHHRSKKQKYGIKPSVSPKDQLKYKYLIAIDGTSFATSLPWQLLSNSLTIKQETSFPQWYDHLLIPYKHYIPLKKDLSNTEAIIQWLDSHDNEARTIAAQSTEFALENLSLEAQLAYLALLINTLGEKQKELATH